MFKSFLSFCPRFSAGLSLILACSIPLFISSSASSQNLPSYLPSNGLVGWWPFNGNANDESGNGNNGTVNGAILSADRFGNPEKAYSFDGIDDFVDISENPSLILPNGTINIWYKTSVNNRMTLFYKSNYNDASNEAIAGMIGYLFSPGGPTGIQFGAKFNSQCLAGQGWIGLENSLNFSDGNYHLLSCVIAPFNLKIYVDGLLADSASTTAAKADTCSPSNLRFGKAWNGDSSPFFGALDDISIYNRALSQQEITALYQGGNSSTSCATLPANLQQGLAGYWPFCGNALDESGNGNNGTVNGATLTADRFGNAGKAMDFEQNQFVLVQNLYQSNINGYSVSAWFKKNPQNANTDGAVVSGSYPGQAPGGLRLNMGTINRFQWQVEDSPGQNGILQLAPGDESNYCDNSWHFVTATFSSNNGLISSSAFKIYVDGKHVKTISNITNWPSGDTTTLAPVNNGNRSLVIGNCGGNYFNYSNAFLGSLDDIAIWNRALSSEEISQLYEIQSCASPLLVSLDTNQYSAAPATSIQMQAQSNSDSTQFQWESNAAGLGWMPIRNNTRYSGADSSRLQVSGIAIGNHLQQFRVIGRNAGCRDTSATAVLQVSDTCINTITVNDTNLVTVTDTLVINVSSSVNILINKLKAYPNPTTGMLYINTGNYTAMPGYNIRISSATGQLVFEGPVNQALMQIPLADFGSAGLYYLNLYNASGGLVTSRKIVLN